MSRALTAYSFILLLFFCDNVFCAEYDFQIKAAELQREGDRYVLTADIVYRFSEAAVEALKHGVPLTLDVRIQIKRKRRFLWDRTVLDDTLRFRLRYHALAKSFQIVNEKNGVQRNFATLETAVEALGSIRGLPVIKAKRIKTGKRYRARLRARLDIESLPLPLRPMAYLNPRWYLSSPWHTWQLKN